MRYYYNRKATVEESYDISTKYLKQMKLLSGKHSTSITWTHNQSNKTSTVGLDIDVTDDPHIRLYYTTTDRDGTKTDYDYEVSLVTTDCYFGGVRYWFGCDSCGRRVGVIYLAPNDTHFRCRHCNNLSYRSRNRCNLESFGHISRQVDKLRSEIKRWTYEGKPTRKVRQLQKAEQKAARYGGYAMSHIENFKARLRRKS